LLKKLKTKLVHSKYTVEDMCVYSSWHKINYNFIQNIRYFHSGKNVYLQALDVRLLYSIVDIFVGYFILRNIVWEGEKLAIKWLQEKDTDFLKKFQEYLSKTDRAEKVKLYRKLAQRALEPMGGLWKDKSLSIVPTGKFSEETIEKGFQFWNRLLNTEEAP
jgi:hypothetical protein